MKAKFIFNQIIFHVLCSGIATLGILTELPALALDFRLQTDDPVLLWNNAALEAITNTNLGPTPTSRALGMLNTSIYDAWSIYDPVAISTENKNNFQVTSDMNGLNNKRESISYAAYNTLVDLFPTQKPLFNDLMNQLGYDYTITSTYANTAVGIGNFAAQTLLDSRHQDGSNQLNGYASNSEYKLVNTWDKVNDPNYWQPLSIDNGETAQKFLTPHWSNVKPFALTSGDRFLPTPPAQFGTQKYVEQALQVIEYSAELTDKQKVIAEYWADGPVTVLPPGHWNLFGQFVSVRDGLTLDDNVKLFFGLGNAVFDAGIAAWDAKEYYNYVRPFTAIRYLASNGLLPEEHPYVRTNSEGVQEIYAWGGPNQNSQWIDGSDWLPYQNISFVTPPFAEYVSGHSTFSAAGAEILRQFTQSDYFGGCHTQPANSSVFESNTPTQEIKLCWDTFTDAAQEAGISRLYGGIHFQDGDINGQVMGRKVGATVWDKTQFYINGGISPRQVSEPTSVFSLLAFTSLIAAKMKIRSNKDD